LEEISTHRHVIPAHFGDPFSVTIEPALRTEDVWVWGEDFGVAVGYPAVDAHFCLHILQ
jgi:hypothetical protein